MRFVGFKEKSKMELYNNYFFISLKKKVIGIIVVIAIAAVARYNVYTSQNNVKLSDLVLNNVEAWADLEDTKTIWLS